MIFLNFCVTRRDLNHSFFLQNNFWNSLKFVAIISNYIVKTKWENIFMLYILVTTSTNASQTNATTVSPTTSNTNNSILITFWNRLLQLEIYITETDKYYNFGHTCLIKNNFNYRLRNYFLHQCITAAILIIRQLPKDNCKTFYNLNYISNYRQNWLNGKLKFWNSFYIVTTPTNASQTNATTVSPTNPSTNGIVINFLGSIIVSRNLHYLKLISTIILAILVW